MRTAEEVRAELDRLTAELESGVKPSRLLVLYNRAQALRWVLGDVADMDEL